MKSDEYPILFFETQKAWESWLMTHHAETLGVWLKFAKKKSGHTSVQYDEALDVALCYGWIDSQTKSLDDAFYLQKFTPRGPRSIWSKINTAHIERLTRLGKMEPAGVAQVEAAKKDGRWERAYSSPETMQIPEDFLQLLTKHAKAHAFFQTLNKTNRYAIAWRIETAKKEETRQRRMQTILTMLEKGEKFHS
ncbi:MAG: hypothetical protein RLZZ455_114 [Candidatus Parcubacteria bacterium]|jgi:uncharacterized protein YdeI (YjbR/CyaY-like superfamily)